MSWDWTKEELLQELKEREEAGEAKEVTFDFIWAVVERAYKERDQFVGLPQRPTNRWAKYCGKDYFDVEKKQAELRKQISSENDAKLAAVLKEILDAQTDMPSNPLTEKP